MKKSHLKYLKWYSNRKNPYKKKKIELSHLNIRGSFSHCLVDLIIFVFYYYYKSFHFQFLLIKLNFAFVISVTKAFFFPY
jgi:intein-encoded DNA endonuclease-like protein